MKTIYTAPEAAEIIGCPVQKLRIRMQRKLWDLGAVYSPEKLGKTTWTYEIYRDKLEKFLGRKIEEGESCGE